MLFLVFGCLKRPSVRMRGVGSVLARSYSNRSTLASASSRMVCSASWIDSISSCSIVAGVQFFYDAIVLLY